MSDLYPKGEPVFPHHWTNIGMSVQSGRKNGWCPLRDQSERWAPRTASQPGYPERSPNGGLFGGLIEANALVEGTWGAAIHEAVAPRPRPGSLGCGVLRDRGMTAALFGLPAHRRRRLVEALRSGQLSTPYSPTSLRSVLGLREGGGGGGGGGEDVLDALEELEGMSITGRAAAWIRAVDEAVDRLPRPDLVWSGPEVPGLHARDTRRVYEELLGAAEDSIWKAADAHAAFSPVARLLATEASAAG